MIELTTYPSGKTYKYKTKTQALKDIKDNGLTRHLFSLIDTINKTTYKGGIWLNSEEYKLYENGLAISYIKFLRRRRKK